MPDVPTAKPAFAGLFEDDPDEVFEQVRVGMPPLADHVAVSPAPADLPDLSKQLRVWLLIGRGGTGKTLLARWLADTAVAQRRASHTTLAALDPTNRTLAEFFPAAEKPRTAQPEDTFVFLRHLLKRTCERRRHGIWDFGGGDLSLTRLIAMTGLEQAMRLQGVALVPVYLLTPSVDDLALLQTHTEMGFTPRTTLLVRNLGRAVNADAFKPVRAQDAYRQAVERGAVEIEMPRLDDVIARLLERKRAHFFETAAEDTAVIGGIEAMLLRDWLARMRAAFAPVETWMPWG